MKNDESRPLGLEIVCAVDDEHMGRAFHSAIEAFFSGAGGPRRTVAVVPDPAFAAAAAERGIPAGHAVMYLARHPDVADDQIFRLGRHAFDAVFLGGVRSKREAEAALALALCGTRVVAVTSGSAEYDLLAGQPLIDHVLSDVRFDPAS